MTKSTLIYITASDKAEALSLAQQLIEEQLIACANILGEITSVYRWDGQVTQGREVAVLLKTHNSLVNSVTERVKELHSYDCPCVIAIDVQAGNPAFLQWIADETNAAI